MDKEAVAIVESPGPDAAGNADWLLYVNDNRETAKKRIGKSLCMDRGSSDFRKNNPHAAIKIPAESEAKKKFPEAALLRYPEMNNAGLSLKIFFNREASQQILRINFYVLMGHREVGRTVPLSFLPSESQVHPSKSHHRNLR